MQGRTTPLPGTTPRFGTTDLTADVFPTDRGRPTNITQGSGMSDGIAAGAAERHALAHRIDRFVKGLERARRAPNRRESYHVIAALRCLQDGRYEMGQAAMADAERVAPLPPEAAARPESDQPVAVTELRTALDVLLAGRG